MFVFLLVTWVLSFGSEVWLCCRHNEHFIKASRGLALTGVLAGAGFLLASLSRRH